MTHLSLLLAAVTLVVFISMTTAVPNKDAASCPTGWVPYEQNCYNFVDEEVKWSKAVKGCQRRGGFLAHTRSYKEMEFYAQNTGWFQRAWVGIVSEFGKIGPWRYTNSSLAPQPVSLIPDGFHPWLEGAPTTETPFKASVVMFWFRTDIPNRSPDSLYYRRSNIFRYICQRPFLSS